MGAPSLADCLLDPGVRAGWIASATGSMMRRDGPTLTHTVNFAKWTETSNQCAD
jgi:hypothetical protein